MKRGENTISRYFQMFICTISRAKNNQPKSTVHTNGTVLYGISGISITYSIIVVEILREYIDEFQYADIKPTRSLNFSVRFV